MRTVRVLAIAVFALSMLLVARPVNADIPACHTLIGSLKEATQGVTISDKDRATLLSKLDGADAKIDQAKFCDALQKLNDYKSGVLALQGAAKPKISTAEATTLLEDVQAAIDCVTDLACAAGSTCGGTITCP